MRVMIFLVLALLVSGCASTQPLRVTAPCPKITIPPESHYPIRDIKKGDSHEKVAKAYAASFGAAYDYIHKQLWPRMRVYE